MRNFWIVGVAALLACGCGNNDSSDKSDLAHAGTSDLAVYFGDLAVAGEVDMSGNANIDLAGHDGPNPSPDLAGKAADGGGDAGGCMQGLTNCRGACVNLQVDNLNCGGCASACAPPQVCQAAQCLNCPQGQSYCNGGCLDTSADAKNCGACGNVCPMGQGCVNSKCGGCANNLTSCGGVCVDVQTDAKNCGMCGTLCQMGQPCVAGKCAGCIQGLNNCNGKCVDLSTDSLNCGACGLNCMNGKTCVAKKCV